MADTFETPTAVFAGVAILARVLIALDNLSERTAQLEHLHRRREVEALRAQGQWPKRGRGRPKGSRNKPKPNGIDQAAAAV
jgi:hypothetical protein